MSKSAPITLPDLDDAEYATKLQPLRDAVIPRSRQTQNRTSGFMDKQTTGYTKARKLDPADTRNLDHLKSRISVAEHIEHIEQLRGPKRRFEFLIPARVGEALTKDAAERGQSAATRLLEVLRDAGYPVIPEDFVDLRKEKRRG
jgi:hypothetical protein